MKMKIGYLILVGIAFASSVWAQTERFTPSSEQLEIFKKLPREQQRALAQKYGLDLASMNLGAETQETQDPIAEPYVLPRPNMANDFYPEERASQPDTPESQNEELKPFGYDLFAGQPTTFAPVSKAPVPSNYLISLGDKLVLNTYGKESLEVDLNVNRQGQVMIPGLTPLNVAGLTYSEAKQAIKQHVEGQSIGVTAHVNFGELGSIQVFVLGDAYVPGSYVVSSLSTITHALFVSGGIKNIGSLRDIQLKRAGKRISTLDLYDLLLHGDTRNDAMLQSGDVIFIPSVGHQVAVDGAVNRPSIYEVKSNETYGQLLEMAGGSTGAAYLDKVNAYSYAHGSRQIQTLDLQHEQVLNKPLNDIAKIHVPEAGERLRDAIQLIGEVSRPGYYQWLDGITLSSLIDSETGFFTENTDIDYAFILRREGTDLSVIQFSPAKLLAKESADLALHKEDKIFVFSNSTKIEQLLSFEQMGSSDDNNDLIKEKVEAKLEEQFFWDMYAKFEEVDRRLTSSNLTLPNLFELENRDFIALVQRYEIYRWDINSRYYLMWAVYKMLLDANRIGESLPLVEITGNVRHRGAFPLSASGSLAKVIEAAGGLTDVASPIIKISRESQNSVEQFDVHIEQAADFIIQAKDKIAVFTKPEVNEFARVQIKGEVRFPGTYTVKRGELLSSLIAKAGGLTEYAHSDAAIFTRESLKVKEKKNLLNLAEDLRKQVAAKRLTNNTGQSSAVNYQELQKVLSDLTNTKAIGRMVIDLPAMLDGKIKADVELVRGDMLIVPPLSQTVSVVGEVFVPTSHRFNSDFNLEDYIASSGGVKQLGDDTNIFVIRANGAVLRPSSSSGFWYNTADENSLKPGDTIVVPLEANPVDNLTLWSSVTQILYQTGVAIAAIGSL